MDVRRWFDETPPVTMAMSILPYTLAGLSYFKFFNTSDFAFIPRKILNGEVWRVLTGLFYPCPWELIWLVGNACRWLELNYYTSSIQFLYRILFLCLGSLVASYMFNLGKPAVVLNFALIHITNQRNVREDEPPRQSSWEFVSFLLPFVMDFLLHQGEGICTLYGLFLGQLLVASEDIIPLWHGTSLSKVIDIRHDTI